MVTARDFYAPKLVAAVDAAADRYRAEHPGLVVETHALLAFVEAETGITAGVAGQILGVVERPGGTTS